MNGRCRSSSGSRSPPVTSPMSYGYASLAARPAGTLSAARRDAQQRNLAVGRRCEGCILRTVAIGWTRRPVGISAARGSHDGLTDRRYGSARILSSSADPSPLNLQPGAEPQMCQPGSEAHENHWFDRYWRGTADEISPTSHHVAVILSPTPRPSEWIPSPIWAEVPMRSDSQYFQGLIPEELLPSRSCRGHAPYAQR